MSSSDYTVQTLNFASLSVQVWTKSHLKQYISSIHEGECYPCDQCDYKATVTSTQWARMGYRGGGLHRSDFH